MGSQQGEACPQGLSSGTLCPSRGARWGCSCPMLTDSSIAKGWVSADSRFSVGSGTLGSQGVGGLLGAEGGWESVGSCDLSTVCLPSSWKTGPVWALIARLPQHGQLCPHRGLSLVLKTGPDVRSLQNIVRIGGKASRGAWRCAGVYVRGPDSVAGVLARSKDICHPVPWSPRPLTGRGYGALRSDHRSLRSLCAQQHLWGPS